MSLANRLQIIEICVPNKDNGLDATPLADSGISKRLIKRHSFIA